MLLSPKAHALSCVFMAQESWHQQHLNIEPPVPWTTLIVNLELNVVFIKSLARSKASSASTFFLISTWATCQFQS